MAFHKKIDWTPMMDRVLRSTGRTMTEIANALDISRNSVAKRFEELGLEKPGIIHAEWNICQVGILKEEWAKNTPTREIGILIGRTKNAVIGRAHRMGLEKRAPSNGSEWRPRKERPPRAPRVRAPKKSMAVVSKKASAPRFYPAAVPITKKAPISIMELDWFTCRAIVGHGSDGLAVYCGDMTFGDKSFCEGHCAMYYQPPDYRRSHHRRR